MHAEPRMAFNMMETTSRSAVTSLSPKEDLIRERARLFSEGMSLSFYIPPLLAGSTEFCL